MRYDTGREMRLAGKIWVRRKDRAGVSWEIYLWHDLDAGTRTKVDDAPNIIVRKGP